jgi:DNA transformation protein
MKAPSALTQLTNIGTTLARALQEIGVRSREDLQRMGAVAAYQRMRDLRGGSHLPYCYYLYSLEGALRGVHWNRIPERKKQELRARVAIA